MPKSEYCPVCKRRMLRLYRRMHECSASRYAGHIWYCPDGHTIIDQNGQAHKLEQYLEEQTNASA